MKIRTKKIITAAMLAALCCIATMVIKIPSPLSGYINLGDCICLVSGFLLSPVYGFLAAGIGSALADLFYGYVMYAPATFLIKGAMALVAGYGFSFLRKRTKSIIALIISGIGAEIVMVLGYYLFEGFLYGFLPALANIPANAVQGVFGIIAGVIITKIFEKHKILK